MSLFIKLVKYDLLKYTRDKVSLFFALLFPLITIFILTSAFSSIMNENFTLEPFKIAYTVNDKSPLKGHIEELSKGLKTDGITLVKESSKKALESTKEGKYAGYVNFGENEIKFYKNDEQPISTAIFQSILQGIAYQTGTNSATFKYMLQNHMDFSQINQQNNKDEILLTKLDVQSPPSSKQYYGIAMIVNNILFTLAGAIAVISRDRKYGINRRIALTNANPFILFFSRVISTAIYNMLSVTAVLLASKYILDIDFGNHLPLVIGLVMLFALTATAIGVFLGYLFTNSGLARTLIFTLGFFLNFFGGSYVPYIDSSEEMLHMMEKLPVYYINRSLIEISTRGTSDYLPTALMVMLIGLGVSIVAGVILYSKREVKLCTI